MTMAYSSTIELLNQAIISKELQFITNEDYLAIKKEIESITNKINALRNHFLKNQDLNDKQLYNKPFETHSNISISITYKSLSNCYFSINSSFLPISTNLFSLC
jgi:translation initiation factor 6 (eIF-6)